MKTLALIAATTLIATTAAASAHDYSSGREARIDARQAEQAYRIAHNRRSGELTLLEKWRLKSEQRGIARMERAAKSDGYITSREASRIAAAQNDAGRDIYRESHDRQKAWWRRVW